MNRLVLSSLVLVATGLWPALAAEAVTLPPEIYAQMKGGKKLGRVWLNPKYDVATGFVIGKVSCLAEGPHADDLGRFPNALGRVVIPGSTNVLNLAVTELTVMEPFSSQGAASATMAVEGQVVDRDGQLMFAFIAREKVDNRDTGVKNLQAVMDKVVWSIAKDLGEPLERALQVKYEASGGSDSGQVPPRPKEQSMTIGERLIQLENLRKAGLISADDYEKHKTEIMKGL